MKKRIWLLLGLVLTAGLICGGFLLAQTAGGGVGVKMKTNADGTKTVSFQGVAGKTYRVESSDDGNSWEVASPDLVATSAVTEWRDARGSAAKSRFYQVTVVTATTAAGKSVPAANAGPVAGRCSLPQWTRFR